MKCLFVTPFVPYPPRDGGRIRMHALIRGLGERHDVEVLTLAAPEETEAVEELQREGFSIRAIRHEPAPPLRGLVQALASRSSLYRHRCESADFRKALGERLSRGDLDIVQCEFSSLGGYVPESPAAKPGWLIDAHNLEFRIVEELAATAGPAYRLYAKREARKRRVEEGDSFARANRVLAVSESDASAIHALAPGATVSVVPNGVDLDRLTPSELSERARPARAAFVGKMDFRPNVDGVRWFVDEVLPLLRRRQPDFGLTICGGPVTPDVAALGRAPGVHVEGPVEDTRACLEGAAVVVVPLRAGSGTRLKILEAFALGRPVVSTSIGCEGLGTVPGEHLLVADEPVAMVDAILHLLARPDRREELGRAGRHLVEERFGWAGIIDKLEEALVQTADRARAATSVR